MKSYIKDGTLCNYNSKIDNDLKLLKKLFTATRTCKYPNYSDTRTTIINDYDEGPSSKYY